MQKDVINYCPSRVWDPRGRNCDILKPPKYNLIIRAYQTGKISVLCFLYKRLTILNILAKITWAPSLVSLERGELRELGVSGIYITRTAPIRVQMCCLHVTHLHKAENTNAFSDSCHCFLEFSSQATPGTIESWLPVPDTEMRLWHDVIQSQSTGGGEEKEGADALPAWPW